MAESINHGRVYPLPNKLTQPISLFQHLSSSATQSFNPHAWQRRILRGDITVDGSVVLDLHHAVLPDSQVAYHRPPWNEPVAPVLTLTPPLVPCRSSNFSTLNVLYRDPHVLAIHKPPGLPTMPSQTYAEYTVLHTLRTALKDQTLAPPQPVHRLGVGTSGVLLIATSLVGRQELSKAIRERRVQKVYRALVTGAHIPDTLRISCPIGPVPFPIGGGTLYAACPETTPTAPAGKPSLSLVRVVRRNVATDQAVVEVEIPTGRPHQIRIHMAYAGFPLVGDPLYLSGGLPDTSLKYYAQRNREEEDNDTDEEGGVSRKEDQKDKEDKEGMVRRVTLPRDCGYSLHAHRITFEHPTMDGKWMTITAPPPDHLM